MDIPTQEYIDTLWLCFHARGFPNKPDRTSVCFQEQKNKEILIFCLLLPQLVVSAFDSAMGLVTMSTWHHIVIC